MNQLQQLSAKIQSAKAELQEVAKREGKVSVAQVFSDAFAKFPEVKAVRWKQGAPSFNDGDPCYFSVHDAYVYLDDPDEADEEHELGSSYGRKYFIEAGGDGEAFDVFSVAWHSVNDETVLEAIFGDGAQVTVTATAVEVEEWDDY